MAKIKIAIADDHSIFRKGIAMVLEQYEEIKILWEAADGLEVQKKLDKQQPEILLMDINMPGKDGLEILEYTKETYPSIKVIFLSMFDNQEMVMRCVHNGANGFLSKNVESDEIYQAISDVHHDDYHFNELLNATILLKLSKNKTVKRLIHVKPVEFSEKELAVLKLICEDKSSTEIASEVCSSPRTIDAIRQTLKEKTGASSIAGLVVYAMRNNLFK